MWFWVGVLGLVVGVLGRLGVVLGPSWDVLGRLGRIFFGLRCDFGGFGWSGLASNVF